MISFELGRGDKGFQDGLPGTRPDPAGAELAGSRTRGGCRERHPGQRGPAKDRNAQLRKLGFRCEDCRWLVQVG